VYLGTVADELGCRDMRIPASIERPTASFLPRLALILLEETARHCDGTHRPDGSPFLPGGIADKRGVFNENRPEPGIVYGASRTFKGSVANKLCVDNGHQLLSLVAVERTAQTLGCVVGEEGAADEGGTLHEERATTQVGVVVPEFAAIDNGFPQPRAAAGLRLGGVADKDGIVEPAF
jgi:hypothetical protein